MKDFQFNMCEPSCTTYTIIRVAMNFSQADFLDGTACQVWNDKGTIFRDSRTDATWMNLLFTNSACDSAAFRYIDDALRAQKFLRELAACAGSDFQFLIV